MGVRRRVALTAVVVLLTAGGAARLPAAAARPTNPRPSTAGAALPAANPTTQGCVGTPGESAAGAGHGEARIGWNQLRNPILSYARSGVRDIGLRLLHGTWHLFLTSVVGNTPDWRVADTTSRDLTSWSSLDVWAAQPRTLGLASPDITRRPDGTYVVTYQSDPGEVATSGAPAGQDKLYYRTSHDLVHWSSPHRLMAAIHPTPDERLIDAALAWTGHGVILGYKFGLKDGAQHFEIAWAPSGSLDGPWTYIGRPDISVYGDTIENYQFLRIDGVWHLLATSNNLDRPWLFTLGGDPSIPAGWLTWDGGRELEVPLEGWNRGVGLPSVSYEIANSAYLCDARTVDGYFYLLYIGTNELSTYGGWGHTKLGIARSRDLLLWEVPCGAGASTPMGCVGG